MHFFNSILPPKELFSVEDLINAGLFDTSAQVKRAIEEGLPGIRTGYRSIKFPREPIMAWLESKRTKPKAKPHQKPLQAATALEDGLQDA
jgi:hypothetical protein